MKKTKTLKPEKRRKEIAALAMMPDERIDFSDIPELTKAHFRDAKRGQFYRPIKKPVTIRLDADVIEWLKQDGRGYQTKANRLLRTEMLRSFGKRKKA